MSAGNSSSSSEQVVFLGYIEDGDIIEREIKERISEAAEASQPSPSSSDDSQAPWLINKIGGTPIFPYSADSIQELDDVLDSLSCKQCKSPCVLILQILSPIDDSSADRLIQIYTCVKIECSRHSWFSLRCMLKNSKSTELEPKVESRHLKLAVDAKYGFVLTCPQRAFFRPYYISVIEEPTGRENFAKNNLEALKLASKFTDPDLKPAPIEEKYKNLKNYKPPQPHASLSDLDDFEKFQMEKLYGNDKDMYRFYKRISRYQGQILRYDWEGLPLLNSNKIKLSIQSCASCSGKRNFEMQVMSSLINHLETDTDFDKESLDFSSVLLHSCSKNCDIKTFNLEDTFFMPDPDSRIFNKLKQRMIKLKIEGDASSKPEQGTEVPEQSDNGSGSCAKPAANQNQRNQQAKKVRKRKKK